MVWQYRSPIPVGRRGVPYFYLVIEWFLPAFAAPTGTGWWGSVPGGACSVLWIRIGFMKKTYPDPAGYQYGYDPDSVFLPWSLPRLVRRSTKPRFLLFYHDFSMTLSLKTDVNVRYLPTVRNKPKNPAIKLIFLASWKPLLIRAGSGSGVGSVSVSKCHGSGKLSTT